MVSSAVVGNHSIYAIIQLMITYTVIRLEIMPMCCLASWMVKQWAICAHNVPNGNFKGLETQTKILDNAKQN